MLSLITDIGKAIPPSNSHVAMTAKLARRSVTVPLMHRAYVIDNEKYDSLSLIHVLTMFSNFKIIGVMGIIGGISGSH